MCNVMGFNVACAANLRVFAEIIGCLYIVLIIMLGLCFTGLPAGAQELMVDPLVKAPGQLKPLYGEALKHGEHMGEFREKADILPQSDMLKNVSTQGATSVSKPLVLKGGVNQKTFVEALEFEADVDWYGWYLNTRRYLKQTRGLKCTVGDEILFHKQGHVGTTSRNLRCQASVLTKYRRLPKNTQLDILILPVRGPVGVPPATRKELIQLLKRSER